MKRFICYYLNHLDQRVCVDVWAENLMAAEDELFARRGVEIKRILSIRKVI